jgi:hypothetical protein
MADAVEAAWQNVDEETADELERRERHCLEALAPIEAVVFPPKNDAVAVVGDQPAVGDGDAVGIAGQNRARTAVDDAHPSIELH